MADRLTRRRQAARPPTPAGLAAFPVRFPVYRDRPWLSDTYWVAHESLPLFAILAQALPQRGAWRMTPEGPTQIGDRTPDLGALMADLHTASRPCVVNHDEYRLSDTRDEALAMAGTQEVDVIDPNGAVWTFDHDKVAAATLYGRDWSWRLALHRGGAALVGVDRKDRPRFALMSQDGAA